MNNFELTYANFVTFVEGRSRDEEIYHGCGWNECAVGAFYKSTGRRPPKEATTPSISKGMPVAVFNSLNYRIVGNYGELQDLIMDWS